MARFNKSRHQVMAICFIIQAVAIGVKGNIDILWGKPWQITIPWMAIEGIALVAEAGREKPKNTTS